MRFHKLLINSIITLTLILAFAAQGAAQEMVVNGGFEDAYGWTIYDLGSATQPSFEFNYTLDKPVNGADGCLRIHGSASFANILFWQELHLQGGAVYSLSGAFKDLTDNLQNFWCQLYLSVEKPVEGQDWQPANGSNSEVYLGFNTWTGCGPGVDGVFQYDGCDGRNSRFYTAPGEPGEITTVYLGLKTGIYANSGTLDFDVLVDDISLIVANQANGGVAYYMDSENGDDGNSGAEPSQAWKTLERANSIFLQPGDSLMLAANSTFEGQLKPSGSGAQEAPIVIGMYGAGDRPKIEANGEHEAALLLQNVEYYIVKDLEITNHGPKRKAGRKGVHLAVSNFTAHGIHLDNLFIHDVNGSNIKSAGGGYGIHWSCSGANARFDGLLIENCHLVKTDRNGITGWSDYCYPWWHWNPSTNVVIRNNLLENIGGDGIVPIGTEGCLVEHNTIVGGRMRALDYAAGIWPWGCKNTIIQYNKVSGMKGTKDGQAFDCDYECSGTIIQYNYSHDNEGGFLLVCSPSSSDLGCRNSIIRYNISQNDGSNSRIFHISGGRVINTKIYNNTIYSNLDNKLFQFGNWEGWPTDTWICNNIFFSAGRATYEWGQAANTVFENNVFYGNHVKPPTDSNGITENPLLVNPGNGGDEFDSLEGYFLQAGSPCIGAGVKVPNNGDMDFWGHKINQDAQNIGAYEGNAASSSILRDIDVGIPRDFYLAQNYPNPFNPSTTIEYRVPRESNIELTVYNSIDQKVATLKKGPHNAGEFAVKFNAAELSNGVYFYVLRAEGAVVEMKKMLVLK